MGAPASSGASLASSHSSWFGKKYLSPQVPETQGSVRVLEPGEGEVTGGRGGAGALPKQRGHRRRGEHRVQRTPI